MYHDGFRAGEMKNSSFAYHIFAGVSLQQLRSASLSYVFRVIVRVINGRGSLRPVGFREAHSDIFFLAA
jgi:hypothetical protein